MPKLNWKQIGIGMAITFFAFQLISLILKSVFPETGVFSRIVRGYSLAWIWIILGIILSLVGYFVFNIKNFDKKSVFISLISLALISFIVIYFNIDLGQAFDMSITQSHLGSIISPIGLPPSGSIVGDSLTNVWVGFGTFGQGAILVIILIVLIAVVINKK